MFIDSHCHINFPDLANRLDDVLHNMQTHQVDYALAISVSKTSFAEVSYLIENHDNLFGTIGIHPDDIDNEEFTQDEMIALCQHNKIVGVGETGLDYHWCQGELAWQHQRFITHIKVAQQTGLPLVIHTRDAGDDTLQLLREYQVSNAVIHCFTESKEFAKAVLELGLYISFSGIVTFKNAKDIQQVCQYVPDDRILIETDAPYLAPVPFRGKLNEPAYVKYTAEFVAQLRNQTVDHIAKTTSTNFFNLFNKAKPLISFYD